MCLDTGKDKEMNAMRYTPWLLGHTVELPEMLDGRERRAWRQSALLAEGAPSLVCFTMNIAGPIKIFPLAEEAFDAGCDAVREALARERIPVRREEISRASYGWEAYLLTEGSPLAVKKALTEIEEEHPLGRLYDIDVLGPDGTKVSRPEVGMPARRCLLCGKMAAECARSRTHTVAALQEETVRRMADYIRQTGITGRLTGRLARMALLQEVYTTPKPGLVDLANTGAHRDMDVPLFEASARAIEPYFETCFAVGRGEADRETGELLAQIRPAGIQAEADMFAATGGVNTHKGIIFSLGILCCALGRHTALGNGLSAELLLDTAGEIAAPALAQDFTGVKERGTHTHGEQQYLAYGISGIRGEAAAGFPSVRAYGLPYFTEQLEAGRDYREAGVLTLLHLIAHVTDTNMIARGGIEGQRELQEEVRALLASGEVSMEAVEALDQEFIRRNISPGGSADLLAIVYFLWELRELA